MLEFTPVLAGSVNAYDTVSWVRRDITITSDDGTRVIYSCPNAEFPETWSEHACRIAASKYFRESRNAADRETSVRQMIERVVQAIVVSGVEQQYFDTTNALIYADELRLILLHQMASFNSPVWFNLGVPGVTNPQVSACFINSVDDNMDSILELAKTEGLIFKEGSGSGVNFSKLRGSEEHIRGGGTASGPLSFMRGYDAFASVILSGGRTRRAARMCILDIDHPDIMNFINCKADQEDVVATLVEAGYSTDFTAKNNAYDLVRHQSGNNSIRVTDAFMEKIRAIIHGYEPDADWELINRADTTSPNKRISYKKLFQAVATAAWKCGDPGLQFDTTINRMNTCAGDNKINGANPCGEFVWHDNSACNLASINLYKYAKDDRSFDTKLFKHTVRMMLIAQDILIDLGSYPTEKIRDNSHTYRPLGLGYTNLGGLLMSWGLPYDSTKSRNLAAALTSLLTAQSYLTSIELAETKGPFAAYDRNKACMEEVLDIHYGETRKLEKDVAGVHGKALTTWQEVMGRGFGKKRSQEEGKGFRNAQVTVLAPTGTISFIMDCATTGVEPDVALRKTKYLIGGSKMIYANPNVEAALTHLGYGTQVPALLDYVKAHGHFEGSTLRPEDLPVFDCALTVDGGTRSISVDGHILMMAAVQPFLSGAISKTVNLDHDATPDDIVRIYLKAWEHKLKGLAIYRSGSKLSEPMRVRELKQKTTVRSIPQRKSLPDNINSSRHKFSVGGHEGYFHVGTDQHGNPVEVFVRMAKFGSTVGGLLDSYAILFSKALQYDIPLSELISHMEGSKFPPAGFTTNPKVRSAGSILDYLAQWLRTEFIPLDEPAVVTANRASLLPEPPDDSPLEDLSADTCPACGALMRRSGTCSFCTNCSHSSGVCG